MSKKVAVLVAVKNSSFFLRGCLDSLVGQTIATETEVIIIDGGSQGKDKAIVSEYAKLHPCLKYMSVKKSGLYHAWNAGIRSSKSRYLINLNSDDRLGPDALRLMSDFLDKDPETALVYGDSYITHTPNETFNKNSSHNKRLDFPKYTHVNLLISCVCGPHPMWRRSVHGKIGLFDENYKICGDYEFWLRMADKYKITRIPGILGLYYKNPFGLSSADPRLLSEENLKIKRKYLYSHF